MPLIKGRGKAVLGENIKEFHTGQTYARTKAKFGKVTADKQAIAAAYAEQRRSGKAKATKRGKS